MKSIKMRSLVAVGFAAGFALPAAAQTNLCGGIGDNGQWIGGNEASSDISTAGNYLEQMALVLLRNEYVALFNVSSPTQVRVEAQGRGGGDPVIDLRDQAGNIILSDDDSGGGGASRAESMLNPGTYCLSMTSYDGSPMTGFVRVGRTDQEALTVGTGGGGSTTTTTTNNNFGATGAGCSAISNFLGNGGPIDGTLGQGGVSATASVNQVDAWGFSLSSQQTLSILAENPSADPVITLYDSFGNYLAENDDFDGLNSRIDMLGGLAPGDYCIEMRALSDENQPITVSVVGFDAAAALVQQYDNAEVSPPLDGSHPVTSLGLLPNRMRQDITTTSAATWMSFDIDETGLLLIETVSQPGGDPVLYLFDDFGRQIAYNDDSDSGLDSLMIARVNPGTYLVAVKQYDDPSPNQTRVLFERYQPRQ